ncbi:MAG: NADP-dependent malic enzyme [Alphaproteobacteria bacterium]|jgi:malate dehydrogenase (oxaloacetate-decarboxylating)|nr:NADP-dependent malic enzyme [Alphaproteobacteria bacterium]
MTDIFKKSLEKHKEFKGKLEIGLKVPLDTKEDLSLYYSPGVAAPCEEIAKDVENSYVYTNRANTLAIISDGSAVLGLGNIGAEAGMPVMEGKAALFKKFVNIDCYPLCIGTQDSQEIIKFAKLLAPSVAGIHLEDIAAPRCVEIEETLKKELNIPVFHDDQHGTAIVVSAGVINACKLLGKKLEDITVVVSGTGAAGSSIIKNLYNLGIRKIRAYNSRGVLHKSNPNSKNYDFLSQDLLNNYVKDDSYTYNEGTLVEAIKGCDVFIGVSVANIVSKDMVKTMNKDAIIFAMANPNPEISYPEAKEAGARVVGTGRSDYPNQINNLLGFPGIFRGALDAKATKINQEMITAAIHAIADMIPQNELTEEYIVPSPFNMEVHTKVSKAVSAAAVKSGVVRK